MKKQIDKTEIFEITHCPQGSETKGDTWAKNKEVRRLGELLGLKAPKEVTWGDYKTAMKGINIDICADRRQPVIVLTVGNGYDKRIRLKGILSAKQINNLKAKIENQVQARLDAMNRGSRLDEQRRTLSAKGIEITYEGYVKVNGVELYRNKNGKLRASETIYFRGSLSADLKGGEKSIDRALLAAKKDLLAELKKVTNALKTAEKNKESIDKYLAIKNGDE